ncbi:MAG: alpha/beta hydrolase, partial [Pseudomonadota bacterium]
MTDTRPPPIANLLRELPNLTKIWSSPVRPVGFVTPTKPSTRNAAPVLVLPGILSSDPATSLMRRTLKRRGYNAYGSKLGVVTGVTPRLM